MSTINAENSKPVRRPLEVHVGINAEQDVALDVRAAQYHIGDKGTLFSSSISAVPTTEFSGEGFQLDADTEWYEFPFTGTDYKFGIFIRNTGSITVHSAQAITALSIYCTQGEGTITYNGIDYDAAPCTIIPVTGTTFALTFTSTGDQNLQIATIVPGVVIEWTNESIISCNLALRSDLSDMMTVPVSEIEVTAYWPENISAAIANINDGTPIYYYSGYPGDYSPVRYFYLCESVQTNGNKVTVHGQDASALLDTYTVPLSLFSVDTKNVARTLYVKMHKILNDAGVPAKYVTTPAAKVAAGTVHHIVMREGSARDHIAWMMNFAHSGTVSPVFVDAGRPRVYATSTGTTLWHISEENVAEFTESIAPNINRVHSEDDEFAALTTVTKGDTWEVLTDKTVVKRAGQKFIWNFDDWHWAYSVTNQEKRLWTTLSSVAYRAKDKTTTIKVKKDKDSKLGSKLLESLDGTKAHMTQVRGKALDVANSDWTIRRSGIAGRKIDITPLWLGQAFNASGNRVLPYFGTAGTYGILQRSVITGSFVWRGNPKMQPRDRITFTRLDGTTFNCTIESIDMAHADGGLSVTINYRRGVI